MADERPRIFADFQNADVQDRVRLTTVGTQEELDHLRLTLTEGLEVVIYEPDEFEANAQVTWSDEGCWVAIIQGTLRYVKNET